MSKTKTTSIRSIIRQFAKASEALQAAKERHQVIASGVLATFVTVPELGACHYFTPMELDHGAARYVQEAGLKKGTKAFAAFQERIAHYKSALNQLALLREEWEQTSGLAAARDAENEAFATFQAAWDWMLSHLAYPADRPAIFRYLANGNFCLDHWRLREALNAASKAGKR